MGQDVIGRSVLFSLRIGVSFVALAPLVVASVNASRNELLKRLEFLAKHDPLTGLNNRRAFLDESALTVTALTTGQQPLAVMLLDIDNFKSINDHFGHTAGDRVLATFSEILMRNLRPGDKLGRLGGEEFGAILPDCSLENACEVAERINVAVRSTEITLQHGQSVGVTVSIGIYVAQGENSLDLMLTQADSALYKAKQMGRDRYEVVLHHHIWGERNKAVATHP